MKFSQDNLPEVGSVVYLRAAADFRKKHVAVVAAVFYNIAKTRYEVKLAGVAAIDYLRTKSGRLDWEERAEAHLLEDLEEYPGRNPNLPRASMVGTYRHDVLECRLPQHLATESSEI